MRDVTYTTQPKVSKHRPKCKKKAWNQAEATEDKTPIDPGLGLGAPLKVSHRLSDFQVEVVPYAKLKWHCSLKDAIPGLHTAPKWMTEPKQELASKPRF